MAKRKSYGSDDRIIVPRFEESLGFYASAKSSAVMRNIRSKNTKAEVALRKMLWALGHRYRLHARGLIGKPDLIFTRQKVIVFIDGGFWHGYQWEQNKKKIKTNKTYWIPKIERNMQRDREVTEALEKKGWRVLRFWDHQVKKNPDLCAAKVLMALGTIIDQ